MAQALTVGHFGSEPGPQRHECEQREQRRHEASATAGPKAAQRDPVVGMALRHQQRGDQEPRQHEEEVDPEVPTRQVPEVMGHHRRHGQAAEPVEGRAVRDPRGGDDHLGRGFDDLGSGVGQHGRSPATTLASSATPARTRDHW